MKVPVDRDILKKLERRAENAAFSASEMAEDAAEKLRGKAEDRVRRFRLERSARELEEEIELQMCAIGQLVYAAHQGRPTGEEDLRETLAYVDSLRAGLEDCRRELKRLEGALLCRACGAENDSGSVYCRACGRPLDCG